MDFISNLIAPFEEIYTTIQGLLSFFPSDITVALLAISGFLVVVAIKRAVI